MPVSGERFFNNSDTASSPPAEAPMATTGIFLELFFRILEPDFFFMPISSKGLYGHYHDKRTNRSEILYNYIYKFVMFVVYPLIKYPPHAPCKDHPYNR